MARRRPRKSTAAKEKLVLGRKLKAELEKTMKEINKLDQQRQKLELHAVRIEVDMANRQIPGSACPVRVKGR
ncbi:MAG TPA: hypothetical protein VKF32_16190 [Thermoanaerobaculia bacterium]|nr:hypothetical protein [Thermoanaerobaculia bacterium]